MEEHKTRPKIVVILGATGSGKSRLSVDISPFFPIEIINADSMQVYEGLDVLTNKLPTEDRKGVPHHLLGSVNASVDFTAKDFRDQAILIIDDILSRNLLPVIVGGTNYYIQALVSPFLLDDFNDDDECHQDALFGSQLLNTTFDCVDANLSDAFELLRFIDPVAANRIHPNNQRKVTQYLNIYASSGVLPSKLFQGKSSEKWGRVNNFRYDCCFIWVDACLQVLDKYVDQRVDNMMQAGLLTEVYGIYKSNADYTRGLMQAVGVREFEELLKCYCDGENDNTFDCNIGLSLTNEFMKLPKVNAKEILNSNDKKIRTLLNEAVNQLKANTRRLVRRQKRRLNRLSTLFGWDLHHIDATEAFLSSSCDPWTSQVVEPCVSIIRSFLGECRSSVADSKMLDDANTLRMPRDLWTQYICEACGNRILRGTHEWEEHIRGRRHRKRVLSVKKSQTIPASTPSCI